MRSSSCFVSNVREFWLNNPLFLAPSFGCLAVIGVTKRLVFVTRCWTLNQQDIRKRILSCIYLHGDASRRKNPSYLSWVFRTAPYPGCMSWNVTLIAGLFMSVFSSSVI